MFGTVKSNTIYVVVKFLFIITVEVQKSVEAAMRNAARRREVMNRVNMARDTDSDTDTEMLTNPTMRYNPRPSVTQPASAGAGTELLSRI